MAIYDVFNFPDVVRGDTVKAQVFHVSINAADKDLTNTTITCEFRKSKKTGSLALAISDGDGITKSATPTDGTFTVDAFSTSNFSEGTYYYDIQFNDNGVIKTYIMGTIKVIQDTTQS